MRFIIDFANQASDEHITEYFVANGCVVIREFDHFNRTYLVEADAQPVVTEIVESVVADDSSTKLRLLEADTKTFDMADDDNWWKLAVITNLDLTAAEGRFLRSGRGVRVYVLDSGIQADHPDFVGKDIGLLYSVTDTFEDTTGHGTAITSVIVGESCGICEAAVRVVKIFHQGRETLMSDLLAAFDAVANDYMTDGNALAVMNMSWAIEKNAYLETKIQTLIDMGVFAVSSAGNDGRAISEVTPASMRDVITVGAFDQELKPCDFSNYTGQTDTSYTAGQTNYGALDYFAPGMAIRIAKPDGTFGYTIGTSIAAAITSAVLAVRIRTVGYSWDRGGDESSVDFMVRSIGVPNLLTLEGNYADSVNLVPTIDVASLANRSAPRSSYHKVGATILMWAYSPELTSEVTLTGPSWLSLDGNYIVGTAPTITDRIENHLFSLQMTNIETGEVTTVDGVIFIIRDDVTFEEAKTDTRAVAIEFNYCADYCVQYCCDCCEDKDGNITGDGWRYCQTCYDFQYGCGAYVCH